MHQLVSDGSLCEYYIPTCGSWVVAHLRRIARSKLYRWRKRSKQASCMTSDWENDNVMRTKRARGCESRVIPTLDMSGFSALFSHSCMLLRHRITTLYAAQKSVKQ